MIRIWLEWLCALLAVLLSITCTLGSCVFYAGWCVYRVAFRVKYRFAALDR